MLCAAEGRKTEAKRRMLRRMFEWKEGMVIGFQARRAAAGALASSFFAYKPMVDDRRSHRGWRS